MNNRPQVLFLGNGVNRAYNGGSWKNLLKEISVRNDIDIDRLTSPMPLQAILVTNNDIQSSLKAYSKNLYGRVDSDTQKNILREILTARFDHILTTNYSYELEMVSAGKTEISDYALEQMMQSSISSKRAESKYLVHTYNAVRCEGVDNKIWHIHGEARKPSSIILGHYYYGNLLVRMKEYLNGRRDAYKRHQEKKTNIQYSSWIDAFILGDVYILGFGYDLSEFDLWWLLERKEAEAADVGKVYYFTPEPYGLDEKLELLRVHKCVKICYCGSRLPPKPSENVDDREKDNYRQCCDEVYKSFYPNALNKINKMKEGSKIWQSL